MPLSELENHLRNLPIGANRPMLGVVLKDNQPQLPAAEEQSTHIMRPDLGQWHGAASTEVFCQNLAGRCTLSAIPTQLVQIGGVPASLAPRYDVDQGRKLKSETFAARLGDGATLAQCFALLEDISDDLRADQQVLMDMVLFNALIGNSLATAGLFALIYDNQYPRIAPLHGALCAAVFPHLPQRFALPIGEAQEPGQLRAHDWELLAAATQLEPASLATRALDLAQKVRGESRSLAMGHETSGQTHLSGIILSAIEQNCMSVMQSLKGFLGQKAA